jgi:hypothetical protein
MGQGELGEIKDKEYRQVKVDVSKVLQGTTTGAESEADVRNRTRQTIDTTTG